MILDLFAGPGGWSEGLRALGHRDVGIEWDASACATRAAAGHVTIRADVAQYPTELFAGLVSVLIASPPCQAFSVAGAGGGVADLPLIAECLRLLADGVDKRAELLVGCVDPRSLLVCEPLRWALDLQPEWLVCEQVPPVLPIWETIADLLTLNGWRSTWTGVLNAADFGVPQTRQRAILIASRTALAEPPVPTHAKHPYPSLFGPQEQPWVSMADALGWGAAARPCVTVTSGGTSTGGADPLCHAARFQAAAESDTHTHTHRRLDTEGCEARA